MPGLSQLRIALSILAAVLLLALVSWAAWTLRSAGKARQTAAVATGRAEVAEGQSDAYRDAAAITDAGVIRDRQTIIIRESNRDAIQTAPGASDALDPELVRRARVGLCQYRQYAGDAECATMRAADPEQLPATSPPGPAATP